MITCKHTPFTARIKAWFDYLLKCDEQAFMSHYMHSYGYDYDITEAFDAIFALAND